MEVIKVSGNRSAVDGCLFCGCVGVLTSVPLPVQGVSRGTQTRAAETSGEPEDAVRRSFPDTGGRCLDSV